MTTIVDTVFGCRETPVWIPSTFDISTIPNCKSCILRLTSDIAGVGHLGARGNGLNIEENPVNTLSVNGIQHNTVVSNDTIGY